MIIMHQWLLEVSSLSSPDSADESYSDCSLDEGCDWCGVDGVVMFKVGSLCVDT